MEKQFLTDKLSKHRAEKDNQITNSHEDFLVNFNIINRLLVQELNSQQTNNHTQFNITEFSLQFLTDILFLHFIQKKGFLQSDYHFIKDFFSQYRQQLTENSNFYSDCFRPLLKVLNDHTFLSHSVNSKFKHTFKNFAIEFSGLFKNYAQETSEFLISDGLFEKIIIFFERYNFAISETSIDKNTSITPTMLGDVYERFIDEQERSTNGIFYTSMPEVDVMCRLGLMENLFSNGIISRELSYLLLFESDITGFDTKTIEAVLNFISEITIVDPACGSGAFLVEIAYILSEMNILLNENIPQFDLKKKILQKNIFGVDIKDWAIQICTYRLWLWMLMDLEPGLEKNNLQPNNLFSLDVDLQLCHGDSLLSLQSIDGLYDQNFIWVLDFSKVFRKKHGFDIVIGNPPYISHREIRIPNESHQDERGSKYYIDKINSKLFEYYGKDLKISRRSDYYIYFYYLAFLVLNKSGTNIFLTSNAWLDLDYGISLQKFFLDNCTSLMFLEDQSKKSFTASINTIISVSNKFSLNSFDTSIISDMIHFITFFTSLDKSHLFKMNFYNKVFDKINSEENKFFRKRSISKTDLRQIGEDENKNYIGARWGSRFLKAPKIYDMLLEKLKNFPKLDEIAQGEIYRGITTNFNQFFYLPNKYYTIAYSDDNYFYLRSETESSKKLLTIEKQYLYPIIKSPGKHKTIAISTAKTSTVVLIINKSVNDSSKVNDYIKWMVNNNPENKKKTFFKENWYILQNKKPSSILWKKTFDQSFLCHENKDLAFSDQRFYNIHIPKDSDLFLLIICFLNSTFMAFITEVEGNRNLGEGGIDTNVFWLKNLKIPFIKIEEEEKRELEKIYNSITSRPIGSIFTELGLEISFSRLNIEITAELVIQKSKIKPIKDRKDLDNFFSKILGVSDIDQLEMYYELLCMTVNRILKSKSR